MPQAQIEVISQDFRGASCAQQQRLTALGEPPDFLSIFHCWNVNSCTTYNTALGIF